MGVCWYLIMVLICIYQKIFDNIKYHLDAVTLGLTLNIFSCTCRPFVSSSLEKCLFKSLILLLIGLFEFFVVEL